MLLITVPAVIARLYNPDKRHTYNELGIDYVCGTTLVAERMKEKLLEGYLIMHHERTDLEIQVVEFAVNEKAAGRNASDLLDQEMARLLAVFRENKSLDWTEDTPIASGDRVVVALKREGWGKVLELVDRKSIP